MKIAFFHNLPPGGADRACWEIISQLSLRHQIDIYGFENIEKKNKELLLNNFAGKKYFFKLRLPDNFFSLLLFILTQLADIHKKIAYQIDGRDYDLVLATHDFLTKSPFILRFLKTPTVYFSHESFREFYESANIFSRQWKYRLVNFLRLPLKLADRKNFQAADIVFTNSNFNKKQLEAIYNRKVEAVKLGVNRSVFKFKNIQRDNFYLTVGSLAVFKGMAFLIKVLAGLPEKIRFPLVIVAKGGRDKEYLKKLAQKLKVDLVIKSGLSDKQLVELYNKAQLFLFAPFNEPFGLVVLEAIACGCPVIGVQEGGIREVIVNDQNGWLVERDKKKFRRVISKTLKKIDKKFRQQTSNSSKDWHWDRTARMIEKIFLKAN